MWFGPPEAHNRCMFLTPDTTAQLVADRRRAFESFALRRRHRSTRSTAGTSTPAPVRLPSVTDRTPVADAPKAA